MEKVTLMAGCLSYWYKRVLRYKGWQAVRIDLFLLEANTLLLLKCQIVLVATNSFKRQTYYLEKNLSKTACNE